MNILELIGIIFLFFLVIVGSVIFLVSEVMTKKVKNFIPIRKEQIEDIEKELRTQKGREDENRS